jgi:protein-tyrosine phosphatase
MAAALASQMIAGRISFHSAGLDAPSGMSATPHAVSVMAERGLDISTHRTTSLDQLDLQSFDTIVALAPNVAHALQHSYGVPTERLIVLNIKDPFGQPIQSYRRCAKSIADALAHSGITYD